MMNTKSLKAGMRVRSEESFGTLVEVEGSLKIQHNGETRVWIRWDSGKLYTVSLAALRANFELV